ncbi:hypothetical protein J6W34_03340 [bacterium]|nr:hypothetical protein [bacterium]
MMKSYFQMVMETKDIKSLKESFLELVKNDGKYKTLYNDYKKDTEKMVELIDYVMEKYKEELKKFLKQYNVEYEDVIDVILGK